MSRDIKFRIWDGKRITTTGIMFNNSTGALEVPTSYSMLAGKIPENKRWVIMQYTGLKDKNGTEIYEGDVCKVCGHPQLHQRFEYDALVIWQDFSAGFKFEKTTPTKVIWDMGHNECEVIGNIYQNPELLTK